MRYKGGETFLEWPFWTGGIPNKMTNPHRCEVFVFIPIREALDFACGLVLPDAPPNRFQVLVGKRWQGRKEYEWKCELHVCGTERMERDAMRTLDFN